MSLLSLDILEGKTSKYETNHIHMIVDGDISFPVTNMNDKQYGTFFHEYIHYLQHFTTMFGVKICTMYNGKSSVSCPLKPSDSAPLC